MTPKYPHITVMLTGRDGNALAVLGRCQSSARTARLSEDEIAKFNSEAMAGDYDHLLRTAVRWFDCI